MRIKAIATIALAAALLLGIVSVSWADPPVADETVVSPVWEEMARTGQGYDFDAEQFVPADPAALEEADDPAVAPTEPADVLLVTLPASVPAVWW
jgi:hypothetical protein